MPANVLSADGAILHVYRCLRRWIWATWDPHQRQPPSPALFGAGAHMGTDMGMDTHTGTHMMQIMMPTTLPRMKVFALLVS